MAQKSKPPGAQMRAKAPTRKASPRSTTRTAKQAPKPAISKSSRAKVRAYRSRMRAKGKRLIQMWLPDTRTPDFAAEARRQSLLANSSAFVDSDQAWVDALSDWKQD